MALIEQTAERKSVPTTQKTVAVQQTEVANNTQTNDQGGIDTEADSQVIREVLQDDTEPIGQRLAGIAPSVQVLGKFSEPMYEGGTESWQVTKVSSVTALESDESLIGEERGNENLFTTISGDEVLLFHNGEVSDSDENVMEVDSSKMSIIDEIAHVLMEPSGQELVATLLDIFREAEELETATQEGEEITIFSSQESQGIEKPQTPVLQVVRAENTIIIAEQPIQEVTNAEHSESPKAVEPIKTVGGLIEAVAMIEAILQEVPSVSVETQQQDPTEVGAAGVDNVVKQEKPLDIQLHVSEEILTFIDKGRAVLEKIEQMHSNVAPSPENTEGKRLVKIISDQREILIELTTLKKLIELYKIKDTLTQRMIFNGNQTALEELGLHTMSPQLDNHSAFWNVYRLVVLLLASTSERALASDYLQNPQKYGVHVLHA